MIYETLHMVPKIEREPHRNRGWRIMHLEHEQGHYLNRYTKLLLTVSASIHELRWYLQICVPLWLAKKKQKNSASVSSHINSCYFKEYVTGDATYPFRQFYTKLLETSHGVVFNDLNCFVYSCKRYFLSNTFYVILYRNWIKCIVFDT
jgi:hypothetical protein